MKRNVLVSMVSFVLLATGAAAGGAERTPRWEAANPIIPLPKPPLGIDSTFEELKDPPTPERVRLGRWLFWDKRLSADGAISCATCHIPEHGYSEPTPVSTGIHGQKGARKAPCFVNQAWTIYPHFFWDGRAASLEEQALGPIANPIEMGNTHDKMLSTLQRIGGYAPYFQECFGTPEITKERVAKAIADYERTRMSGNSPYDQWQEARFETGFKPDARAQMIEKGFELFNGKAECNQCHLGQNFTDSLFHNLGIGWQDKEQKFADEGRYVVSKKEEDKGAFKTPTLRDVSRRAPYMHDGSIATLREAVQHYNKGGTPNPHLSTKIRSLNLTDQEVDTLVAFMQALDGEGFMDVEPQAFPQ